MKRDYYATPKASGLMRLFWKAAGADHFILERSTYSDQVKYMCLGGIITATGVMAAIAGGYAFYTIFEPKGSSIESQFSWQTSLIAIVFGMLWGAMIFNLDRFIVSSTGKGDGTEAITWGEFRNALPRILMGAIIALTISKPVEIRMFKSEIDVELHKVQMQKEQEYLAEIDSIFAGRIENEKKKAEKWEQEIREKEDHYNELERTMNAEMSGERGAAGYGTEAKKMEEQMNRQGDEIKALKSRNDTLIQGCYANIRKFEDEKQKAIDDSKRMSAGLDGLLERIKLSHELSGWISVFITLLFMAIELTPIFFKLMLTKTPYDYLEENVKEQIKAEEGILIEYNYYKDEKGQDRDLVIHCRKEKVETEQRELLNAQQELIRFAISQYTEDMKLKIRANPEAFIQTETPKNHA